MSSTQNLGRGVALAILGFALFSGHDAIIKTLGAAYAPFQVILFSTLFAFVPVSMSIVTDRAVDTFRPHHPWLILIRTLCMLIGGAGGFYAFSVLPMTEVYALLFAAPLLVTVLAVPFLGETIRLRRGLAVVIGFIGVMVVLRPGTAEFTLGHLAALGAATASAFSNIIVRKISGEERSAVMILIPMIVTIIVMGALMPWVYVPVQGLDLGAFAAIGVIGVIAQSLIIAAYRAAPAVLIAPLQYSQILWAVAFGALFFNELPDMWVGVGAGIIIASGVFIVWRESRSNVSAQSPVSSAANPRPDSGPAMRRDREK
ncbi:MAG: DMT family transporter [Paracoccaceae bacterium]